MKITVIQGFLEGLYEEDMTFIYDGHLTTEQIEIIGRGYGNIDKGGYVRMKVVQHGQLGEGHDAWSIHYFNTPEPEPTQPAGSGDGISTAGDEWEPEFGEEGGGQADLSYSVQHDETEHTPSSSPTDIGQQM